MLQFSISVTKGLQHRLRRVEKGSEDEDIWTTSSSDLPYDTKNSICAMELYGEQSIRWPHRDKNRKRIRSSNLIIFSQSNSSDLGCCLMMEPNFADIADFLQFDPLIHDYPGYGISDGETNEKNVLMRLYAIEKQEYPPEKIILIGFNLRTAAMVHVAQQWKVAALVLIALVDHLHKESSLSEVGEVAATPRSKISNLQPTRSEAVLSSF